MRKQPDPDGAGVAWELSRPPSVRRELKMFADIGCGIALILFVIAMFSDEFIEIIKAIKK